MIGAHVTLDESGVRFRFEPRAEEWVLFGTSLAEIEQMIRSRVNFAYPKPLPFSSLTAEEKLALEESLSVVASSVLRELCVADIIEEPA